MTIEYAREILETEMNAIAAVQQRIGPEFVLALDAMTECEGRVVACGMGKAGLIAKKVATTLASTGTPSFFLHPAEALHGDLGMIRKEDLLLIFSNSGESREVNELVPFARERGAKIVAITGNGRSTLAAHADLVFDMGPVDEACPLGLAPTASTTAMLALGDALALCLMKRRGFEEKDFARLHPGGALGRKALKVEAVMRANEAVAVAGPQETIREVILKITKAQTGAAVVVDGDKKVLGIFCDGDLRRGVENDPGFLSRAVFDVMTKDCLCVKGDEKAADVLAQLKEKRIGEAPVIDDDGVLLGMADLKGLVSSI